MTVRLFSNFVLFVLFSFNIAFSQQVKNINVFTKKLNAEIFNNVTTKFINTKIDSSTTDSLKRTISQTLINKSYYSFRFDSIAVFIPQDSSFADIFVYLDEGYKTIIKDIVSYGLNSTDSISVKEKLSFLQEEIGRAHV